jgi:hypothetical protein
VCEIAGRGREMEIGNKKNCTLTIFNLCIKIYIRIDVAIFQLLCVPFDCHFLQFIKQTSDWMWKKRQGISYRIKIQKFVDQKIIKLCVKLWLCLSLLKKYSFARNFRNFISETIKSQKIYLSHDMLLWWIKNRF